MKKMRTIEIDFDLHKKIETERKSFEETPNDVLRRLTGLGSAPREEKAGLQLVGKGRPWIGEGVELPHGTDLKMVYNQQEYRAKIENGAWVADGEVFFGPSPAASALAVTKKGTKTSLNGWMYWQARKPGQTEWVYIWELRVRAREAS